MALKTLKPSRNSVEKTVEQKVSSPQRTMARADSRTTVGQKADDSSTAAREQLVRNTQVSSKQVSSKQVRRQTEAPAARKAPTTRRSSQTSPAIADYSGFQRNSITRGGRNGSEQDSSETKHVDILFECEQLSHVKHHVVKLVLTESLNEPYDIRAKIQIEQNDMEPSTVLFADCRFFLRRDEQEQCVHGIVSEVLEGSSNSHHVEIDLHVVPAFRMLSLRRDTRIFQERTVPEILDEVLTPGLAEYEREVRFQLDRDNYPTCEYRLQYDETDMDFVHRLLEEEGIFYWFDHDDQTEVLVLCDHKKQHQNIDRPDGETIFLSNYESSQGDLEYIGDFHRLSTVGSTQLATNHFDWTRVENIEGMSESESEEADENEPPDGASVGPIRELYDHDNHPLSLHSYDSGQLSFSKNDVDDQVRLRRQLHARDSKIGQGSSTVIAFRAGRCFDLVGHRQPELNVSYMLTEVEHRFTQEGAQTSERYTNVFKCLPKEKPFRPQRKTAKPRIHGIQTATVVGPPGEEIHTDEHGRIKVQFHWDRLGSRDDHSSCFIRVMQPWSGSGWGFVFLPRIGMEVTVGFLNGDPDQPLVTGTVYNGKNNTPYPLPDEKTKSTIKTQSSPGGEGYNEITFEDAAGEEQVIVHAQKDYNETIENDHNTTVRGDRTITIEGSENINIQGNKEKGGVSGGSLNVTGDYKMDASNTIDIQAPSHIKLTCGGSSILIEPGKITMTAGGAATVVLDANALMKSAAGSKVFLDGNAHVAASGGGNVLFDANANMQSSAGSQVLLDGNALTKSSGGSKVMLDGNALTASSGGSKVLLDGNAAMEASGGAKVSLDSNATMSAPAVATVTGSESNLNGSGKAGVAGGAGTVVADGGGVSVSGPKVALN